MSNYFKRLVFGAINLLKGLIITFKNLITPAITLQYPTQKQAMAERFRGLVDLDQRKCIMCYQCVKICPTNCLGITPKAPPEKKKELESFKYKMELCCFCGLCAQICPTGAIFMNKIYEIATSARKELDVNLLNSDKYAKWLNPTVK
jgi:NADH-quinone oxidoreductase subunit I